MAVDLDLLSGAFKITYTPNAGGALELGVQQDGVRIIYNSSHVPITIDAYGEARIDSIFSGVTDMQVLFTSLEMTVNARKAAFDYFNAATHGLMNFDAGTLINLDASSMIGSLVLTRLTGSAGVAGFNTFTMRAFPLGSTEYLLAAMRLRSWPITYEVYPDNVGSDLAKLSWITAA